MKTLIAGIAAILIFVTFTLFQINHDLHLRAQDKLKIAAEDAAAAGGLCIDSESYSKGVVEFDYESSEDTVRSLLSLNLQLDDAMTGREGGMWEDQVTWTSYYVDDSGSMRIYGCGVYESNQLFSYGEIFTDPQTGYTKLITEPTVIVTVDAGQVKTRGNWLDSIAEMPPIIRSAAYEYVDWK